jgi:hypothetical protein
MQTSPSGPVVRRQVAIFSGGWPVCREAIAQFARVADVTVLDMRDPLVARRAAAQGVRALPALAADGDGPAARGETVTGACPRCAAPLVWRRHERDDGEPALAIVARLCHCPLTAAEWADLAATAAMVAGDAPPARHQDDPAE